MIPSLLGNDASPRGSKDFSALFFGREFDYPETNHETQTESSMSGYLEVFTTRIQGGCFFWTSMYNPPSRRVSPWTGRSEDRWRQDSKF